MGKKYSTTTRGLAKFLYPLIDRYEFGVKGRGDKKPRFAYRAEQLDAARGSDCFRGVRRLTMTQLQSHLSGEQTFFFTSRAAAPNHLLMIDVDAHGGETDAWDAAQWIVDSFFPGAYWEPSTNWLGAHVYLVADHWGMHRKLFNDFVWDGPNSFARYLAAVVADEGFEAKVCSVYGTCGRKEDGGIVERGRLGKVPRPKDDAGLLRLVNMPTFDLMDMKAVVTEAHERGIVLDASAWVATRSDGASSRGERDIPVNRLSTRPSGTFAAEKMRSSSAWDRSIGTTAYLSQQLGRMPEVREVAEVYEERGLATGDADRDRERRHARAIRSLDRSFDPAKATGYSYVVGQYVPDLARLLTTADLEVAARDAGYPRKVTHADMDVALGFHVKQTLNTPERQELRFTVPVDGLIGWFRSLKASGQTARSCNYGKARAVRLALLRAGMITVLDDDYRPRFRSPDGLGVAKKWGLGENCPQFADFVLAMSGSATANRSSGSHPCPSANRSNSWVATSARATAADSATGRSGPLGTSP